jgi:hypothetical protein
LLLVILFALDVCFGGSRRRSAVGALPVSRAEQVPGRDEIFLDLGRRLGPPYDPEYSKIYDLPAGFVGDLRRAIEDFPINPQSGRRQVMFTIFDMPHIRFAQNLFCSTVAVKFDLSRHLFIALEQEALRMMQNLVVQKRQLLHAHTLLLD